MFFGLDIPFRFNELESKEKLRKYFNISKILSADQVIVRVAIGKHRDWIHNRDLDKF